MEGVFSLIIVCGFGYFLIKFFMKIFPQIWFVAIFVVALFVFLMFRSFLQASGLDVIIMVIASIIGAWAFAKRKA